MQTRIPYVAAAATTLVLGFGLGSAAPATAAALTKGAVKKIAVKVVRQQAGGLSVAHATTADSATNATRATTAVDASTVGGSSAASLRTTGYRYTIPSEATTQIREYAFPNLPAGTYLVTYSLATTTSASNVPVQCSIRPAPGPGAGAAAAYSSGNGFTNARVTGAGIVDITATSDLRCAGGGGTFAVDTNQSAVSFIPIDTTIDRTVQSSLGAP